jgi:hypothetical protein
MRTARSRTSGENLFVVLLIVQAPSHIQEPPEKPGRFIEMLEKFYGQTVSSALAARISKGNQTVGDGNGKVYPFG